MFIDDLNELPTNMTSLNEAGIKELITNSIKKWIDLAKELPHFLKRAASKIGIGSFCSKMEKDITKEMTPILSQNFKPIAKINLDNKKAIELKTLEESANNGPVLIFNAITMGVELSRDDIAKQFRKYIKEAFTKLQNKKMNPAAIIFLKMLVVSMIATTLANIIIGFVGMGLGLSPIGVAFCSMIVTSGLIAPYIEEKAKLEAIKAGLDKEFLLIFNLLEFSMYVLTLTKAGMNFIVAAFIRGIVVVHHYFWAFLQKNKFDNAKTKAEKETLGNNVIYHAVNNSLCVSLAFVSAMKAIKAAAVKTAENV